MSDRLPLDKPAPTTALMLAAHEKVAVRAVTSPKSRIEGSKLKKPKKAPLTNLDNTLAKNPLPQLSDFDTDDAEMTALLNEKSDHVTIIVGASYIDASLSVLLQRRFLEGKSGEALLDPVRGPLGTFNAKANLCYVLGLITKEHMQDVLKIAEMRNYCAHDRKIKSFSDARIMELYAELKCPHQFGVGALDHLPIDQRFKMMIISLGNEAQFVARRIHRVEAMNLKKFAAENMDKRLDLP